MDSEGTAKYAAREVDHSDSDRESFSLNAAIQAEAMSGRHFFNASSQIDAFRIKIPAFQR